jgi:hypothetical protein
VTGRVLKDRGDLDGWRAAWQQAIDEGYQDAEWLLDEMLPPAEDVQDDEPADVPAGFDPRNIARTGIAVLDHELPPLPEPLTRRMAVPMAYWTARDKAVASSCASAAAAASAGGTIWHGTAAPAVKYLA